MSVVWARSRENGEILFQEKVSHLNLSFVEGLELAENPLSIFADTVLGLSGSGAIVLHYLFTQGCKLSSEATLESHLEVISAKVRNRRLEGSFMDRLYPMGWML